jgi:hypothetical protein
MDRPHCFTMLACGCVDSVGTVALLAGQANASTPT